MAQTYIARDPRPINRPHAEKRPSAEKRPMPKKHLSAEKQKPRPCGRGFLIFVGARAYWAIEITARRFSGSRTPSPVWTARLVSPSEVALATSLPFAVRALATEVARRWPSASL